MCQQQYNRGGNAAGEGLEPSPAPGRMLRDVGLKFKQTRRPGRFSPPMGSCWSDVPSASMLRYSTAYDLPPEAVEKILKKHKDICVKPVGRLCYYDFIDWLREEREDEGESVFLQLVYYRLSKAADPNCISPLEFIALTKALCEATPKGLLELAINGIGGPVSGGTQYASMKQLQSLNNLKPKRAPTNGLRDSNDLLRDELLREMKRNPGKGCPEGCFSLPHLQAVHKRSPQCLYWLFYCQDFFRKDILGHKFWKKRESDNIDKGKSESSDAVHSKTMTSASAVHASFIEGSPRITSRSLDSPGGAGRSPSRPIIVEETGIILAQYRSGASLARTQSREPSSMTDKSLPRVSSKVIMSQSQGGIASRLGARSMALSHALAVSEDDSVSASAEHAEDGGTARSLSSEPKVKWHGLVPQSRGSMPSRALPPRPHGQSHLSMSVDDMGNRSSTDMLTGRRAGRVRGAVRKWESDAEASNPFA